MDPKEEGILLGELKAFREMTIERLDKVEEKVDKIDVKVDDLNTFKVKVTAAAAAIFGLIELGFRLLK